MDRTSEVTERRKIGSLTVSTVGLGCNNFGWKIEERAAREVVAAALDHGVTFFDTADSYCHGQSEEFLGRALGGKRDGVVIATKFGMKVDEERRGGAAPSYIRSSVEGSLRRLGTDVIDLYYLHQPDPTTPIEETVGTLQDLRKEGKIREFGCSNFEAEALVKTNEESSGSGFVAIQNEYSLLHRQPEEDGVLKACEALQVAFIPYFPLKSGLLTGKYRKRQEVPAESRLGTSEGTFAGMGDALLRDDYLDTVESLIRFAQSHDRTILDLAFSWLLSKPVVSSVISGATTPEQVEANVKASGWKLTADELAEVDSITKGSGG